MLVCNVSQARRAAIAAGIVEAATAADAPGTGNVVFATLVDDPASVLDTLDAVVGQIMREVASAEDAITAGMVFAVAINEAAFALEASSAAMTGIQSATMVETASAADVVDSLKVAGARFEGALALDGPITPAASQPG